MPQSCVCVFSFCAQFISFLFGTKATSKSLNCWQNEIYVALKFKLLGVVVWCGAVWCGMFVTNFQNEDCSGNRTQIEYAHQTSYILHIAHTFMKINEYHNHSKWGTVNWFPRYKFVLENMSLKVHSTKWKWNGKENSNRQKNILFCTEYEFSNWWIGNAVYKCEPQHQRKRREMKWRNSNGKNEYEYEYELNKRL